MRFPPFEPAKVLPGGVLFRGLNPAETELYTAGKLAFQPSRPMKAPFNLYDHHEHVLEEFLRTPADPSGRPNAFVSLSHELQIPVLLLRDSRPRWCSQGRSPSFGEAARRFHAE